MPALTIRRTAKSQRSKRLKRTSRFNVSAIRPETQEAAIHSLAARSGDDEVTILSDLDISGKKRRDKRPGWDELLRAVETGEASSVGSLGRSVVRAAPSNANVSTTNCPIDLGPPGGGLWAVPRQGPAGRARGSPARPAPGMTRRA